MIAFGGKDIDDGSGGGGGDIHRGFIGFDGGEQVAFFNRLTRDNVEGVDGDGFVGRARADGFDDQGAVGLFVVLFPVEVCFEKLSRGFDNAAEGGHDGELGAEVVWNVGVGAGDAADENGIIEGFGDGGGDFCAESAGAVVFVDDDEFSGFFDGVKNGFFIPGVEGS